MQRIFTSDRSTPSLFRTLDVRADEADARDYVFKPSLDLVPPDLPPPAQEVLTVRDQETEGACVGFALAAVINLSLRRRLRKKMDLPRTWKMLPRKAKEAGDLDLASERMLYEMAQRYDEWRGEHYEGTSLRGAMKGWHKHGVCSRDLWPYKAEEPGTLTKDRRKDACRRPLGAYYRIVDSDVSQVQAAIYEGDAVLASAWVHSGWRSDGLEKASRQGRPLARIPFRLDIVGLHAFALVGYGPWGFVVQNSWGTSWGTGGLAFLSYEDWFENRQDAWVARPGVEAQDYAGTPRIFLSSFGGGPPAGLAETVGTTGADGLDLPREALSFLINTGDRGKLDTGGRLRTKKEELPEMAARVRLTQPRNGFRDVVLYAHGGLVSEQAGAESAGRIWKLAHDHQLAVYSFIWETGYTETLLGLLRSRDDAAGPRAGLDLGSLGKKLKKELKKAVDKAQKGLGAAIAPLARKGWKEMKDRSAGASTQNGGARLFCEALFRELNTQPGAPFRLHLYGHSAGAIYLADLYEGFLREALSASQDRVRLGTVELFAPGLSLERARRVFAPQGALPIPSSEFRIHVLQQQDEERDSIGAYPSSLLTYAADHLEDKKKRVPLLGIETDIASSLAMVGNPRLKVAQPAQGGSEKHGHFNDSGRELDQALLTLAGG